MSSFSFFSVPQRANSSLKVGRFVALLCVVAISATFATTARAEFRAEEYISMAGGPTSKGSFGRISIISREGQERGASKDSIVKRGETILVKRSYTSMMGSFFVTVGSLSAIVLSIVALSRTN